MNQFFNQKILFLLLSFVLTAHAGVGFNTNGFIISTADDTNTFSYNAITFDGQGRIVAAGESNDLDGLIARYNSDGSVDVTFNGTGFLTNTNVGSFEGVALDMQGNIVVVGSSDNTGVLVRYLPSGSPDNSFGNAGLVTTNNVGNYCAVAIDTNDKIVAVGTTDDFSTGIIVRYLSDGTLDSTFNSTNRGYVTNAGSTQFNSLTLNPTGTIIAVGYINGFPDNAVIARYLPTGILDTSFNQQGNPAGYVTDVTSFQYYGVVVDRQGNIVVSGRSGEGGMVIRYLYSGQLDSSFGTNGSITDTFSDYYNGIIIDALDNIIIAGYTTNSYGIITRHTSQGLLDSTFNGTGYALNKTAYSYQTLILDSSGRIVIAGKSNTIGGMHWGLIGRYLGNGTLDTLLNWNLDAFVLGNAAVGETSGLLG